MEEMAGGEDGGLTYSGWIPVNNPSLTLVNNPPIKKPLTQALDFPYFVAQQEEINGHWVSRPINPWQQSNSILERQPEQEEVYGVSRPIYPWQQTNSILERQQEGGIFPSLQLSPPAIALGGIALSLLVAAVLGWMHASFPILVTITENHKDPSPTGFMGALPSDTGVTTDIAQESLMTVIRYSILSELGLTQSQN